MSGDLDDLARKISEAKASGAPDAHSAKGRSRASERAGMQAGLEFAMCIGLSVFLGYHADQYFGTRPAFLIGLFFLGVGAGFWTLYKYSVTGSTSAGFKQLHEAEKTANKAPERELNSLETHKKEE